MRTAPAPGPREAIVRRPLEIKKDLQWGTTTSTGGAGVGAARIVLMPHTGRRWRHAPVTGRRPADTGEAQPAKFRNNPLPGGYFALNAGVPSSK